MLGLALVLGLRSQTLTRIESTFLTLSLIVPRFRSALTIFPWVKAASDNPNTSDRVKSAQEQGRESSPRPL